MITEGWTPYIYIIEGVFHETFVSFTTFEVYIFKDFNFLERGVVETANDIKLIYGCWFWPLSGHYVPKKFNFF